MKPLKKYIILNSAGDPGFALVKSRGYFLNDYTRQVTVPDGTGKAAGWNCMLVATHATGTITLSASGTTLNGTTVTTTQFETLSLVHYGSENYLSKLG